MGEWYDIDSFSILVDFFGLDLLFVLVVGLSLGFVCVHDFETLPMSFVETVGLEWE